MSRGAAGGDTQADGLRLPADFTVHSSAAELCVKARLGYETVKPTMMSYLMVWFLLIFAVIMGFTGFDRDVPKRFGIFFLGSLAVLGTLALAANFLNRAHLLVNGRGVTAGIRPAPVNGLSYHRRLPVSEIAGIYATQCDLWPRPKQHLVRSYEVHALTTKGEAVCLLQRIPEMSAANDLAIEIRKRLGPLTETAPRLRGQKRWTSEKAFQFAGFLPSWFFWLGLVLIGLEIMGLPFLRLAGWKRVPAKVSWTGRVYHTRRSCTVGFETPAGPVSTRVQNRCASGASAGDMVTVYYNPAKPTTARMLTIPLWPVALIFCGGGLLVLILGRERAQYVAGTRILWQEKFDFLSPYWHLTEKQNAEVGKGILTLSNSSEAQVLPYTELAFEPGGVEVKVRNGERAGPDEEAGILYAGDCDGKGYVFGIVPGRQTAFARRVGKDWSVNLMPVTYVREIAAQPGGWNTLKVAIDDHGAHFFVNGARAGSADYQPAMGGGMVGLYATFGARQSVWQFSGLMVLA